MREDGGGPQLQNIEETTRGLRAVLKGNPVIIYASENFVERELNDD